MIHGLDMLMHIRSRGRDRVDSSYCPLQDGNPYGYKKEDLYSKEKIYYTLRLIHLLDKSFICKNLHLLSIAQQKLMEEWLREGNEKTDNVNYVINKYIQRFDEFLGSYRGGWGFKNSIRRPIDREMENV